MSARDNSRKCPSVATSEDGGCIASFPARSPKKINVSRWRRAPWWVGAGGWSYRLYSRAGFRGDSSATARNPLDPPYEYEIWQTTDSCSSNKIRWMAAPLLAAEDSAWITPGYVPLAGSSPLSPGAIVCRHYVAGRLRRSAVRAWSHPTNTDIANATLAPASANDQLRSSDR